jgi:hypothetical protein
LRPRVSAVAAVLIGICWTIPIHGETVELSVEGSLSDRLVSLDVFERAAGLLDD